MPNFYLCFQFYAYFPPLCNIHCRLISTFLVCTWCHSLSTLPHVLSTKLAFLLQGYQWYLVLKLFQFIFMDIMLKQFYSLISLVINKVTEFSFLTRNFMLVNCVFVESDPITHICECVFVCNRGLYRRHCCVCKQLVGANCR